MSNTQQPLQVLTFITEVPTTCQTIDQMKAVLKCRFQKELDEYFNRQPGVIVDDRETTEE